MSQCRPSNIKLDRNFNNLKMKHPHYASILYSLFKQLVGA
jgi:hypothetical protein